MRLFKFLILTFSLQFIMSCNSLPVNKKVYSFSKTTNAVQIELIKKADNLDMEAILKLVKDYNFQETKEGIDAFNKWYPTIENKIVNQNSFSPKELNNTTQVILIYFKYNEMLGINIDSINKVLHHLSEKGSSDASVSIIKEHLFEDNSSYFKQLKKVKDTISESGLNNLYEYFSALYENKINPKFKISDKSYNGFKEYRLSDSQLQRLRVFISLILQEKYYSLPMRQRIYNIPLFLDDKTRVLSLFKDVIHSNNTARMLSLAKNIQASNDYKKEVIKLYQSVIKLGSSRQWIESNKNLLLFYSSHSTYKNDYLTLKERLLKTTQGKLAVFLQLINDKKAEDSEIRKLVYQIVDNINNKKSDQIVILILTNLEKIDLRSYEPNSWDKDWDEDWYEDFKSHFLSTIGTYLSNTNDLEFRNKLFAKYYLEDKHHPNNIGKFHLALLELIKDDEKSIESNNVIQLRNTAFQYLDSKRSYSTYDIYKKYNYYPKDLFPSSDFKRKPTFKERQINEDRYSERGIEYFEKAAFYGDKYSRLKLPDIYKYREYLAKSKADRRRVKYNEMKENIGKSIFEFFDATIYGLLLLLI